MVSAGKQEEQGHDGRAFKHTMYYAPKDKNR